LVQVVRGYCDKIMSAIVTFLEITRGCKHVLIQQEALEFRLDPEHMTVKGLERHRLAEGFFRPAQMVRVSVSQV